MHPLSPLRVLFSFLAVLSLAWLGGCGGGSMRPVTPPKTLAHILISPGSALVGKGKTLQLKATGAYSDGTQQDLTGLVGWTSSLSSVATVNAHGNVMGMTVGSAQVSATYQGITGTDVVTVQPPTLTSISILPTNPSLGKGKTIQLQATGAYSDGTQQDVTTAVSWTTSKATIASVSAGGSVMGMTAGGAVISAVYQGATGTDAVTVQPATLVSIAISPSNPAVGKSKSIQLQATGTYSDGTQQDVTATVSWGTSQASIAAVSASGSVMGMTAGSAVISASYQSVTGTDAVTVQPPTLASLAITPNVSSLPVGENKQLTATGVWSDGSSQDVSQSATWSSSVGTLVGVSGSGAVTAKAVGTAMISAGFGSLSNTAMVTVTPAVAVSLAIVPGKATMATGASRQFQAIATLSDGTTQNMTALVAWASTLPKIATVSSGGRAIGEREGSTVISAAGAGLTATASVAVIPQAAVNYFDLAGESVSGDANTVRLTNPGALGPELCSMIYVFDEKQNLTECCGCNLSDSGLRTLSLKLDLTSNPLTGIRSQRGSIEIVPSDPAGNATCDPRSLSPAGEVLGWETNSQLVTATTTQVTETRFELAPLTKAAVSTLAQTCSALQQLGSGKGVCTCGSGD